MKKFHKRVTTDQCAQFFRRAQICKKTGAFLTKIRALDGRKDGQNSSFARPLLRSATPLCAQSVMNIFGWKIGVNKTNGHFYHSLSYQDHHSGFVI